MASVEIWQDVFVDRLEGRDVEPVSEVTLDLATHFCPGFDFIRWCGIELPKQPHADPSARALIERRLSPARGDQVGVVGGLLEQRERPRDGVIDRRIEVRALLDDR